MAISTSLSTKKLSGARVVGGKNRDRRIGKVTRFVFHPREKRCVGVIVKRPDLLLMFHRKDRFIAFDSIEIEDGRVVMPDSKDAIDQAACKRLGVVWDECVLWEGMPLITEGGEQIGTVGEVILSFPSGRIKSIEADRGGTAKLLIGTRVIPAEQILGFKTGAGVRLNSVEGADEQPMLGAIMVSDEVLKTDLEGGIAEAAGRQSAVALDKIGKTTEKVKQAAKPKVDSATKSAGKAINKGAYATGKQISRAKGMFSAFADEYKKARNGDE